VDGEDPHGDDYAQRDSHRASYNTAGAEEQARWIIARVPPDDSRILILGGGPAGCTAARLLALWGHPVHLVTRPLAADAIGLAESLTPSCGKFFDLLGIRDAIEGAGFVATAGNTVWWGSGTPRVETFANGAHGWQATAPRLEAVMRTSAVEAGVHVEERLLTSEEAAALPARFRIDCTGRSGLLARARAGREHEPGHRTVALSAVWRSDRGWAVPDPSHTLVESYADGWVWSVPIAANRRAVAVMVDPRTSSIARGEGALATYRHELSKTMRMRALLDGAALEGGPSGWDASMYRAAHYAGNDWLVAGDAATFVDPLSSAGVKKALASGWLAAIAVHTALVRPEMGEVARQFFADRETEMYANFLALTRRYLHEAAVGQAEPFWAERAEIREWEERQARQMAERAEVQAAYDRLRAATVFGLVRGPAVSVQRRPAISGKEIVMEARLVTPDNPVGIRFLYDIDVVTLVELAPLHRDVPALFESCVERVGPMDLAAFLTALATAVARGWLVPAL
jgi:flavin-dependent dehydrogenase